MIQSTIEQRSAILMMLTTLFLFEEFQATKKCLILKLRSREHDKLALLQQFVASLNSTTDLEFYILQNSQSQSEFEVRCLTLPSIFADLQNDLIKAYA